MNILHISSGYDVSDVYKQLLGALNDIDVSNVVYVPNHTGISQGNSLLYVNRNFGKIAKFLYWGEQRYLVSNIEQRIILNEISCVHAHRVMYGGYIGLELKKKYGIPYIVAVRNSDLYGFGRNIKRFKRHTLEIMLNASKIIFISSVYKKQVLDYYKRYEHINELEKKSIVISNGIDEYFLQNSSKKDEHPLPKDKEIVLTCVANIEKNKNQTILLKVCDIFITKGYKVKLNLAGKIKNRSIYKEVSTKPYVNYMGMVGKEQVLECLQQTDIFIMPSIHETFGMVYAEAISQGVPVIYTRGQGFDGQFQEGEVGFSTNCYDEYEMVEHIKQILSSYREVSNRCVTYSVNYSWDAIASEYKKIYEKIQ